jgi:SAM-dependent methyltransferase
MTTIDFGKTAGDYSKHRQGFPDRFFDRLADFGLPPPGGRGRVVDLGSGTGTLARGLALRGSDVVGVDIAAPLLEQAARLDSEAGVSVRYHVAPAEATGLPAGEADAVTAGQCWHWFDRPRAAAEAMRLLSPGGLLIIAHLDWLALPGNAVELTEQLIAAHSPAQPAPHLRFGGGAGLYGPWLRDAAVAGFAALETFSFDVVLSYTHEAWRGRARASAAIGASLSPERVAAFDSALDAALAEKFPEEPLEMPHRVFALVGRRPA